MTRAHVTYDELGGGDPPEHPRADGAAGATDADGEAALIAAAQADPAAFEALYRRYVTRIYRYARARSLSDEDAADLTQQVLLRALDALPRFKPGRAPFAAWLFRIARNAAVDAGRRRRRDTLWRDTQSEPLVDVALDPEAQALRGETLARLRAALARLDPPKRDLLALRFAGQLSATEIAAVVGKRPEAVKKQLTRILRTLREHYDDA
ncbi:MAG: RNA polymerase sigma factor [Ktedonobacterales bacterium]